MWPAFESQLIKTDITTVKLLQDHILIGVGGFLHIFNRHNRDDKRKIRIFHGQKIHGIEINNNKTRNCLLFGQCHLNITTLDFASNKYESFKSTITKDWILTAKFLQDDKIALIYMSNELAIFNMDLIEEESLKCVEKCTLYSAHIHGDFFDNLLLFSGTVFSQILVWKPKDQNLTKLEGHKGAIFSLNYHEHYLCSTSDDRTAILWDLHETTPKIKCKVHGHLSRVFRCKIIQDNLFITGGEDSIINLWNFNGELLRKIEAHQGGSVWALDSNGTMILSGGGDCNSTLFSINSKIVEEKIAIVDQVPKHIGILHSGNLVIITEKGVVFYHVGSESFPIGQHQDLKSYNILAISPCRKLFAIAGYQGQFYIYQETENYLKLLLNHQTGRKSRIFSLHWLNCHTFIHCENDGILTLWRLNNSNQIEEISNFLLPNTKERWTTSALLTENGTIIVGDRRGNIHHYVLNEKNPIQTVKKIHNYLGITQIRCDNNTNQIVTLGRNATIAKFQMIQNELQLASLDKVPFTWLAGLQGDFLLAFSGKNFLMWDYKSRRVLFQYNCSGGHRSWDFSRNSKQIQFVFIKDKVIHSIVSNIDEILPINIVDGFHTKEINAIEAIPLNGGGYLLISGGEDTNLRLSKFSGQFYEGLDNFKSHLSSIRTISACQIDGGYLVFSGGGRAHIICWRLVIEAGLIVCTQEYSHYEELGNDESEMRIMDLNTWKNSGHLLLFAACSDGRVKIFKVSSDNNKYRLEFIADLLGNKVKCVMKIAILKIASVDVLIAMATDGWLTFWNVSNVFRDTNHPFKSIKIHQSGINSYHFKIINNNLIGFLTGGDDNAIEFNIFQFSKDSCDVEKVVSFSDVGTHCAQITGVYLNDEYFLTTSIDQKLTIFKWQYEENQIKCEFLCKYNTAVADIQGMVCVECNNGNFDVFLYGKGIEYVKCIIGNR